MNSNSKQCLPFKDYVFEARKAIANKHGNNERFIDANAPFEVAPVVAQEPAQSNPRYECGVLLMHGLLDSPFTFKNIAPFLAEKGALCRSILLPGHGTVPSDLMEITYHDWIETMQYGLRSLREQVDRIYLVGYSTGAALAMFEALQDENIAGIILIAPPLRLKIQIYLLGNFYQLLKRANIHLQWFYRCKEDNYTKYSSIPYNAIIQVINLVDEVYMMRESKKIACPILLIVSEQDETIEGDAAIHFFSALKNDKSRAVVYTTEDRNLTDPRIIKRQAAFPELNIAHLSHVSIPFSPDNIHYGKQGDYPHASVVGVKDRIYGAYNDLDVNISEIAYKLHLVEKKRGELTYNPDFDFMMDQITQFIFEK